MEKIGRIVMKREKEEEVGIEGENKGEEKQRQTEINR